MHESISVQPLIRHVASDMQVLCITYTDGRLERLIGPREVCFDSLVHERIEVKPLKRHVADEHQYMLVQKRDGKTELVRGPAELVFDPLVHEHVEVQAVKRYVADQQQYLAVQYRDGRKEHLRGPIELCVNPFVHELVDVRSSVRLAANEALVVYRRVQPTATPVLTAKTEVLAANRAAAKADDTNSAVSSVQRTLSDAACTSGAACSVGPNGAASSATCTPSEAPGVPTAEGSRLDTPQNGVTTRRPVLRAEADEGTAHVERRVVHGPAVFIPECNEWLHEFSWHGSIKNGKGSKTGYSGDEKVPHALNFNILRCMPDQIYYSVRDVRTTDDAHLTVHLMLFYELREIETMLDSTNDLIGDILNAASADVMTFAAANTYEGFLSRTAELSRLETFPILASRMAQTGTALLKVVYRGYTTSPQLQSMHEEAIARRTKLRLESDAAREEQDTRAMELQCREQRSAKERELEEKATRHGLAMAALTMQQEREQADEAHALKLKHAADEAAATLAQERERHAEELRRSAEAAEQEMKQLRLRLDAEMSKYNALAQLKVDMTKYLTAFATPRPDQHLRIDTDVSPNLHVSLPKSNAQA